MARATTLCCLAVALAANFQHARAAGVQVIVQYNEGRSQQVVSAVTGLGYTVSTSIPEARALVLELPATQQAAASQALSKVVPPATPPDVAAINAAVAPFAATAQQQLQSLAGVAGVAPVRFGHAQQQQQQAAPADVAAAQTAADRPLPSLRDAVAADAVAATAASSASTTAVCPYRSRRSGHGEEVIPWGVDRVQAMDKVILDVGKSMSKNVLVCTVGGGLFASVAAEWPVRLTGCLAAESPKHCAADWNQTGWSDGAIGSGEVLDVLAARWNGVGVVGVAPFDVAVHHINADFVFNAYGFYALFDPTDSSVLAAMQGCVAELDKRKARNPRLRLVMPVIRATSQADTATRNLYSAFASNVAARGDVLVLAPAGDVLPSEPWTGVRWPAGAADVVAVASVDVHGQLQDVPDDKVELVAPGQDVYVANWDARHATASDNITYFLSFFAAPAGGGVSTTQRPFLAVDAGRAWFINRNVNASGRLVDCGLGQTACKGAAGAVCLIQASGALPYCDQAVSCVQGGGVGAILYSGDSSSCSPVNVELRKGSCSAAAAAASQAIALATMSGGDGALVVAALQRGPVAADMTVIPSPQVAAVSRKGTRLATAHASGVAALVWSAFPACKASSIRQALQASAIDLGDPGRDPLFGYGLVQARAAFDYLKAHPC